MPYLHLYKIELVIAPSIRKGYGGDAHLDLKCHGSGTLSNLTRSWW